MPSETLVFRCDANAAIGAGHVMRCLALAQAWQDAGGSVIFTTAELPLGLGVRLRTENVGLSRLNQNPGSPDDADATSCIARKAGARWVVVDGDRFGVDFLQHLRASGLRVLLIDDFARRESFPADLILNPNLGASEDPYRRLDSNIRLLIGESYTLLRREFTSWQVERTFPSRGANVLVTLGGSDPENLAPRIVRALLKCDSAQVTVVAGAGYQHQHDLEAVSAPKTRVLFNPSSIPQLMHQADVAVIAAGGTLWELLYMRSAVLSYFRNPVQERVVRLASEQGAAWDMGDVRAFEARALARAVEELVSSRALREGMASRGRLLVDGRGTSRVLKVIAESSKIHCGTVCVR